MRHDLVLNMFMRYEDSPKNNSAQIIILGFMVPTWLYESILVSLVVLCSNV